MELGSKFKGILNICSKMELGSKFEGILKSQAVKWS